MLGFQIPAITPRNGPTTRILDFTQGQLPSGVSFTRASVADRFNSATNWGTVGVDVPALDYDPVTGTSRGIALRPGATNFALWSNRVDNAAWIKTACTISGTPVTGIDGTSSAYRLIEGVGSATPSIVQTIAVGSGTKRCTAIADVKPNGRTNVQIWVWNAFGDSNSTQVAQAYVLTGSGSLGPNYLIGPNKLAFVSASIELLSNGYYRIKLTYDKATETNNRPALVVTDSASLPAPNYTGNGSSGVFVQHFGLYSGDPSGIIVTTTSSASRAADELTLSSISDGIWDVTAYDNTGSYTERYAVASTFKFRPRLGSRHVHKIVGTRVSSLPTYATETWDYNTSLVNKWGRHLPLTYFGRVEAFVQGAKAIAYDGVTLMDRVAVTPLQNFMNRADDYDIANLAVLGGKASTVTFSKEPGSFIAASGEWTWTSRGFRVRPNGAYQTVLYAVVAFNADRQRSFLQSIDLESSTANNSRRIALYNGTGVNAIAYTVNAGITYSCDGVSGSTGSAGDINVRSYVGLAAGAGDNIINRYSKKAGDFTAGTRNFAAGTMAASCAYATFGPSDWCNYAVNASIEGPKSKAIMDTLVDLLESTLLNEGVGAVPVLLSDGQSNASGELLARVTAAVAPVLLGLRVGPNLLTGGVPLYQWVSGTTSLAMNSFNYVPGATGVQKLASFSSFLATLPAPGNPVHFYFFQGETDSEVSLEDAQYWDERAAFYFSTVRSQFNFPGMFVYVQKPHFSLNSGGWGGPLVNYWTQARRDRVEVQRASAQRMDLTDNKCFVLETYGYERLQDDPTDGMYNPSDNVHWNYETMQKMADALARLIPLVPFIATKSALTRRAVTTAIAAGDALNTTQISNWETLFLNTATWASRCVRLINPLFSNARAKTMDLITGDVVVNPPTVKITYYVSDTLSAPDAGLIAGHLFTLTGSANNEAKQHSLLVSGATTAAANGTYRLMSSHTTPTNSIAYVGTVWVKVGDDDTVVSCPDCTRAGVQQTNWKIEQHGVGVLYQHASTFGSVRPPAFTLWTVGAAGSGTVPTVVENL